MSLKSRVKSIEKKLGVSEGHNYFALKKDDGYILQPNGFDITESVKMTEKEFEKWQGSKGQNDQLYIVSRRESAKENENV
jgi:hypothetical protein